MYGDTDVINSETPKPKKVAIDWTFSLFLDGAASAVVIQMRGDWTPNEISHKKIKAMDTLPCTSDGLLNATTSADTIARETPQKEAVPIRIGLRPIVSGRK
jgi:hypothetical protein